MHDLFYRHANHNGRHILTYMQTRLKDMECRFGVEMYKLVVGLIHYKGMMLSVIMKPDPLHIC